MCGKHAAVWMGGVVESQQLKGVTLSARSGRVIICNMQKKTSDPNLETTRVMVYQDTEIVEAAKGTRVAHIGSTRQTRHVASRHVLGTNAGSVVLL